MESGRIGFFLVLAAAVAAFIYWAQLKVLLFLVMKWVICLTALIVPLILLGEKENHKVTRTKLETKMLEYKNEMRHRQNIEDEHGTLLVEYEKQINLLNRRQKKNEEKNEDLIINIEKHRNELKRMETLRIVYQEFRRWIEDEASSFHSRVCFTEYKPSEVEEVTESLDKLPRLGSGTYGSVYEAVFRKKEVAMKILNNSQMGLREFKQEIGIMKRIRHQNLVTLLGACHDKSTLIYELLPNGTLEDRFTKEEYVSSFSWKERVSVAYSICSALVFLHNTTPEPVAHADLKPSNILFDANNVCKLGDFGISRFLKQTTNTGSNCHRTEVPKGSGPYMDPQFNLTGTLIAKSDVFALGIILLQLVTGKEATGLRNLVHKIIQKINLENYSTQLKKKILLKFKILDDNLEWDEKSVEDAIRMVRLGMECSNEKRHDRPSLESEVWPEIYAMNSQNAALDNDHTLD